MAEKEFLTYTDYGYLLNQLVKTIEQNNYFKNLSFVYGIHRGGLPIAVHLSHYLNLNLLEVMNIFAPPNSILVVDDITDTGETLKHFASIGYITATLCYKKRSIIKPNFYIHETDKWIVFPWENPHEIPNRPD
jgi:hypoxanthine phosphoribosyltransferase